MTPRHTVVTVPSHRDPRRDWTKPRSTADVLFALAANGFLSTAVPMGVARLRVVGLLAIRVTITDERGLLETALHDAGQPVRWRASRDMGRVGNAPWQVAREALELLATLNVDTPVRWG